MKKKTLIIISLLALLVSLMTGCGKEISALDKTDVSEYTEVAINESTKDDTLEEQSETIIEVVEEATTTEEEDGTMVVKTESGDEIKVKPTDKFVIDASYYRSFLPAIYVS